MRFGENNIARVEDGEKSDFAQHTVKKKPGGIHKVDGIPKPGRGKSKSWIKNSRIMLEALPTE